MGKVCHLTKNKIELHQETPNYIHISLTLHIISIFYFSCVYTNCESKQNKNSHFKKFAFKSLLQTHNFVLQITAHLVHLLGCKQESSSLLQMLDETDDPCLRFSLTLRHLVCDHVLLWQRGGLQLQITHFITPLLHLSFHHLRDRDCIGNKILFFIYLAKANIMLMVITQ